MPLPFLEVFPREIRDQIYTYVLASRSGIVTLSPWTSEVARSLSLLRTCKQIHRECKAIIWLHNKLHLHEPTALHEKFKRLAKRQNFRRSRTLEINLEILDRDELQWMLKSLSGLEEWARAGRLESITLNTVWERPRGLAEFRQGLALHKYGESLDGRLCKDESTFNRTRINTGWPRFSNWGKQRWLKAMLLDPSGVDELLKGIHDLFGGAMFVNGVMCFADGKMCRPLNLDPRDAEVRIVLRRPAAR